MNRPSVCRHMFLRSLSLSCALAFLPSLFLVFSLRSRQGTSNVDDLSISAIQPGFNGLQPRHRFSSYDEYLQLQLNKTLNAKLRKIWSTTDWRRKINVFSPLFRRLLNQGLLQRHHKVLCIGARLGQEVVAFKEIGVSDAIGIDLVPAPPLVIHGDIHRHPFPNSTFDLEFSNVLDHALLPDRFVSEIERTLKPHGVAILHVALHRKPDKYSVTDLSSLDALFSLFQCSNLVHVRTVDAFGLDTEVAMRKRGAISNLSHSNLSHSLGTEVAMRKRDAISNLSHFKFSRSLDTEVSNLSHSSFPHFNLSHSTFSLSNFSCTKTSPSIIARAEPLITTEPTKPWQAFKQNMLTVRYLPSLTAIANRSRYLYIDLGARTYASSIGGWFQHHYPRQNRPFAIYAVEPDPAFKSTFSRHSEVVFLPFAAWTRNETLSFGTKMGRIHPGSSAGLYEVQGVDVAEWMKSVAGTDDFLVVKMDVEGAEFAILERMVETGAICLVDELFLECHYNRWQRCCPERTGKFMRTYADCVALLRSLRRNGVLVHQWW